VSILTLRALGIVEFGSARPAGGAARRRFRPAGRDSGPTGAARPARRAGTGRGGRAATHTHGTAATESPDQDTFSSDTPVEA